MNELEPVEVFLEATVCQDRLALYTPLIDLLKETENNSILDAINSIVYTGGNDSPSEIVDHIHESFIKYLMQMIAEFDVIVHSTDIMMLYHIYSALVYLSYCEDHDYIINVCQDDDMDTTEKLFMLVDFIKRIDEVKFHEAVNVVPISLFNRIAEVHIQALNRLNSEEAAEVISEEKVNFIQSFVKSYPQSQMAIMLRDHSMVVNTDPAIITDRIAEFFMTTKPTDVKGILIELIGFYALADDTVDNIPNLISESVDTIFSDSETSKEIRHQMSIVFAEVKQNVKT